MTETLVFVGAKGGVGTSTVAAMTALAAAAQDRKVFLSGVELGDLCAILGVRAAAEGEYHMAAPNLMVGYPVQPTPAWLKDVGVGTDLIVHDAGSIGSDGSDDRYYWPATTYLVTRPCYVALRRAVQIDKSRIEGVVLLEEAGRSLGHRDVEAIVGPVVARVPVTEQTSRLVDAGLLASMPTKIPTQLARLVPALVAS